MKNAINWFEIPVKNFDRAKKFYGAIYGAKLKEMDMGDYKMALLPFDEKKGGVGGGIMHGKGYVPSQKGTVVYLNGGSDLKVVLNKVKKAGGKVLKAKFKIGDAGYLAYFQDTEGNKVGLHSKK